MIGTDGPPLAWRQALTHREGPLLILGGPGTGKSALIAARFLWLTQQGCRPERLAVLAPSDARTDALRARLEADLPGGYETLHALTPVGLARLILEGLSGSGGPTLPTLSRGDRLAMLVERIDELPLAHHDIGGSATTMLGGFIRRIDALKAELIDAEDYASYAAALREKGEDRHRTVLEQEFADIFGAHERMLAEAGARDEGDLLRDALRLVGRRPELSRHFDTVLIDDAQELDLAAARLARELAGERLTAAGDPAQALRRFRGAGGAAIVSLREQWSTVVTLPRSRRCPSRVLAVARGILPSEAAEVTAAGPGGEVCFWRCAGDRAQAQAVAADVERLIVREGVDLGEIAVIVPAMTREGQAVTVALQERAVAHRLVGEAVFFQQAEIRDLLAWLRLLADASDAPAVVRALARPPIELRSVDIARCTQIARRRKLDMVAALAAATESPQVPPEARERIRRFLKLYRSAVAAIDTTRPDLYVHRLIDRLGLRRQQLFAAHPDVVQRLRALAEFGELAAAYVRRRPQATPREFARSISAVADFGLREQEEPQLSGADAVQVLTLEAAGGLQVDHVYVLGLTAGLRGPAPEPIPDALLGESLAADDEENRRRTLAQALYVAVTRARRRAVLCHSAAGERAAIVDACPPVEQARLATGLKWVIKEEELFGPAETLHSTYRLLRDELLEGTMRAAGRLGELRFDTDLDVTHAVVRYLELLKVGALIARPEGQGVEEALRDVNARILQAVTAEQREVFTSSALDEYLLDAERDVRRRAQAVAARDEPSLAPFLPRRGEGVMLSASDIDTYRTCPLKYKFARVFRIPQEPTIHQRFGILVHQVLERFHAAEGTPGTLPQLLGLLDAGWRRGGFGDSEEERQLRGKAATALTRYHERFQSEDSEPVWFERQFTFKLGPHLLRGRVDRVDRLPGGQYELIDYKTGRPKSASQLVDDVQLSLYAVGAREAWQLDASRQAYHYLLDDQKVSVPAEDGDRGEWITTVAMEVAEGILSQGFEPTPSYPACSICDYRLVCPAAER
ncbi:MAG: ATP-dependent helicase [Actinomycetota bacterium]|nr:ATP-dependent helicase [Actinomycetota bacterium]